jgi:Putative phage tail protein
MAETDTASTIIPSVSTAVTYIISPVSETSSGGQVFSSTIGYWLSDPLVLTGRPVTGSVVRWVATAPVGSTVTVQTSINNGASWDTAANNQPIPRLKEGDTSTRFVLAKITMTRSAVPSLLPGPAIYPGSSLYPAGSPPSVSSFEMDVSADASVDELAPIGMGMIDRVTTHATAGTTGAGSSTNVSGSTAVIGRGGGQTGGGTSIKVHANDLSYAIKRNVWQMPFTVPSGMLYTDAIKAMVLDRLPDQTAFNLSTTTRVAPLLVYGAQQGGDPWQDIQELAQAIGFEAYFDPTGVFVCRAVPDPRVGEPVWTFDENAVKLVAEAERDLSSEQTFNDIVVVGQNTSTANPFSAEAFDDDPNSPTYILGPYERVAQRLTFSLITSQDQAQDTANAALFNSLGAADTVTLTVVPMPALEPGDIVKVVCSNVKANGTYMINSMTTPLSPAGPQQLTCFRQSTDPTGS